MQELQQRSELIIRGLVGKKRAAIRFLQSTFSQKIQNPFFKLHLEDPLLSIRNMPSVTQAIACVQIFPQENRGS